MNGGEPSSFRPEVEIDLGALCANYRFMRAAAPGAEAAAVVKCDGYGLGGARAATALALREGCRSFFVASAEEGAALRDAFRDAAPRAAIYVFYGPLARDLDAYDAHALIPVLNSLEQAERWAAARRGAPIAVHIDTGMHRLGAPAEEIEAIAALGLRVDLVMSHLACASDPAHPMNARQRARFDELAALFPGARRSLAASAGALLDASYHYDMTRIGVALYGVSPTDAPHKDIRAVARLTAPVIQIHRAGAGEISGYGGDHVFARPARLATLALGYGDGFLRAGGGRARCVLGGALCPIVGRVSMDVIVVDTTDTPESVAVGDRAELFGPALPIEHAAASCGTIGYELLTRLGGRLARRYIEPAEGKR